MRASQRLHLVETCLAPRLRDRARRARTLTRAERVTAADLEALEQRGATWIAHELVTVKSDDLAGRAALFKSIVLGDPACVASVPRATDSLERHLTALGFDVDVRSDEVMLRFLDDATIRERMPGIVMTSETIDSRTLAIAPPLAFASSFTSWCSTHASASGVPSA